MVSPASMGVALKTLLIVLFFAMIAAYVYIFAIDGVPSCYDYTARWDVLLVMDFTIFCGVIGAWFQYKESNWIMTIIFFLAMEAVGSVVTIPYIFIQFMKLSPEESSKDPLYFMLVRHKKREHKKVTSVVTARVFFSALGVLLLGVIIYTVILDISGLYAEPFAPCFLTYIVDIYIHVALLSVWIAYKESSWITALFWILLLVFFGTITTSVYVLGELFNLPSDQPAYLIIFNSKDRDLHSSEPLLMSQEEV